VTCSLCDEVEEAEIMMSSRHAFAYAPSGAMTVGHTLVVPRAHTSDIFMLSTKQYKDLWLLVHDVQSRLRYRHGSTGFRVNVDSSDHAHVHVIPC